MHYGSYAIYKLKRGTAADATRENPILNKDQIAFETDTLKIKIGDGRSHWNDLPYQLDLLPRCMAEGFYIAGSSPSENSK